MHTAAELRLRSLLLLLRDWRFSVVAAYSFGGAASAGGIATTVSAVVDIGGGSSDDVGADGGGDGRLAKNIAACDVTVAAETTSAL